MKLFKKRNGLLFKIILCLIAIVLLMTGLIISGIHSSAAYAVRQELKKIHAIDHDAVTAYIPAGTDASAAEEAICEFFSSMEYKILSSRTEGKEAEVHVRITNMDTRSLSRDICLQLSSTAIRSMFLSASDTNEQTEDPYALLYDMITQNDYPKTDTEAVFHLDLVNRSWEIRRDAQLSDELVSHLSSNLQDPYILSAGEILQIYLETFSEMNWENWQDYLNMEDIFSTGSPSLYEEVDQTYLELVCDSYGYEILSVDEDGDQAAAKLRVTGPDLTPVMKRYKESLTAFAKTAGSITSDSVTLSDTAAGYLLESLRSEAAVRTQEIEVTLTNNSRTWQLLINDALTDAMLGNLGEALAVFE